MKSYLLKHKPAFVYLDEEKPYVDTMTLIVDPQFYRWAQEVGVDIPHGQVYLASYKKDAVVYVLPYREGSNDFVALVKAEGRRFCPGRMMTGYVPLAFFPLEETPFGSFLGRW